MAVLLGPLWAAAVVLAALGDRPSRGEWEIGLAALAGAAALVPHLDRLLGIVSVGLDLRWRRRVTALPPVAVAACVGLVLAAGHSMPQWSAASRLGSVAIGLVGGLGSIAVGTRGGPILFGFGSAQRKDGWLALSWVAEDDALAALLVIAGLALALSLEEGVAVLAGGGALAAAYWVGLRGVLRRRLLARVRSRVPEGSAWSLVPAGMSPLAWRLLTREGEHVVETVLSAPSGHVRETRRYRAADVDATVAGSLVRLGLRAPRELVVLGTPRGAGEGVVEVVELVHGPADRPGPGRIRWKGPTGHAAASSD